MAKDVTTGKSKVEGNGTTEACKSYMLYIHHQTIYCLLRRCTLFKVLMRQKYCYTLKTVTVALRSKKEQSARIKVNFLVSIYQPRFSRLASSRFASSCLVSSRLVSHRLIFQTDLNEANPNFLLNYRITCISISQIHIFLSYRLINE